MKQETRITKELLREIGFPNVKVKAHSVMMSNMYDNKIYVDKSWFTSDTKDSKIIKKIYKKMGWKISVSMGTFAVLHELGHVISVKMLKDLDYELKMYEKNVYMLAQAGLPRKQEMAYYRNLKLESLADKIAYTIYLMNEPVIKKYDKLLKKLLTS